MLGPSSGSDFCRTIFTPPCQAVASTTAAIKAGERLVAIDFPPVEGKAQVSIRKQEHSSKTYVS
jgi:hypothetical protein